MTPRLNPCASPGCAKARPDVTTDLAGVGMVQCPSCRRAEWGDTRGAAIREWNYANPRPIPWGYLTAGLALAATGFAAIITLH